MNRQEMQSLAARVEEALDEVRDAGDPEATARSERLVRAVMDMYAAGLARVVDLAEEDGLARVLADDEVVGSLLVLHDLHPDDVDTRIQAALDRVRPYLGSHAGGIEYQGVDDHGVAHLRLEGSCDGCPSSSVTVTLTIERAVLEAAPDVTSVDVAGMVADPPLLQIGLRPGLEPARDGDGRTPAREAPGGEWATLNVVPEPGGLTTALVGGTALVVASLDGTAYAYVDECPRCGHGLGSGRLDGDVLTCSSCAAEFDVRLAGRGAAPDTGHLSPLPVLPEGRKWRVALPGGVPA